MFCSSFSDQYVVYLIENYLNSETGLSIFYWPFRGYQYIYLLGWRL